MIEYVERYKQDKRIYIMASVKDEPSFDRFVLEKDYNIDEHKEYVRKNTTKERVHIIITKHEVEK